MIMITLHFLAKNIIDLSDSCMFWKRKNCIRFSLIPCNTTILQYVTQWTRLYNYHAFPVSKHISCRYFVKHHTLLFHCILFYVAKEAVCIQHNFTTLQTELPSIKLATRMLKNVLDHSNISDIDRCGGPFLQKSKLIKIILMKGVLTCKNFVTAIELQLKRTDLVQQMKRHYDDVRGRGNHKYLNVCSSLS